MGETYETSGLTYVKTVDYSNDYWIVGLEPNTKDIAFISQTFNFTARTWNDIIQYIAGQRITDPLSTGEYPTLEEFQYRNTELELYNVNPQPLQEWLNNLPT